MGHEMIPDKMYIHRTIHLGLYSASEFPVDAPGEKEYISKDTLLEWAKDRKNAIEVNGEEEDAYTRGYYACINALIDKLNSL